MEDVLLTGDQSITDAFSCCSNSKRIWYQAAPWKMLFAEKMAEEIPNINFETFKTACGTIRGLHKSHNYTSFLDRYDFRKLGKVRMDSILNFYMSKNLPVLRDYMNIILSSRTINSAIRKFKNKI